MNAIYQITIQGRTLESRDLKKLLARAVSEKRDMDRKIQSRAGLSQPISVAGDQAARRFSRVFSGSGN